MNKNYDVIIIGAGFAGATVARKLADAGKSILVIEKRNHIGGNAYDYYNGDGVLIHKYGPHIFHANNQQVFEFVRKYTDWYDYQHKVVANVHGKEMPVPFNLNSLYIAYDEEKANRIEKKLIETYGAEQKVTILELKKNTDPELKELAQYVYDNVFVYYTMKQWGKTPEEIDPNTTARVPVFISRDDRYFQDAFQGMPKDGYTKIFDNMLNHENIEVLTGVDALDKLTLAEGEILFEGEVFEGEVVYSGAVDYLFGNCYGSLPYRTLDFVFETFDKDYVQSHGTINYTVSEDYTRITEFKHMTGQILPGKTTTCKEYSKSYSGAEDEIPYYAIINDENNALYQKYFEKANQYKNLHLIGRLAEYKYYNMDAIIERALDLASKLCPEV